MSKLTLIAIILFSTNVCLAEDTASTTTETSTTTTKVDEKLAKKCEKLVSKNGEAGKKLADYGYDEASMITTCTSAETIDATFCDTLKDGTTPSDEAKSFCSKTLKALCKGTYFVLNKCAESIEK